MSQMYDRVEFFNAYFRNASEKQLFLDSFTRRAKDKINSELSILDLGSHDGSLVLRVLESVNASKNVGINLTAVDPSSAALENFSKKNIPKNVSLNCYPATAEEYLSKCNRQFDWVIASHCLYWTENLGEVLRRITSCSNSGVIVLRGHKGIHEIQSKFRQLLGNEKERLYQADDIESELYLIKVPFEREDITSHIEIPDLDSREFRWMASFFLQSDETALVENNYKDIFRFVTQRGTKFQHDISFFWFGKLMMSGHRTST